MVSAFRGSLDTAALGRWCPPAQRRATKSLSAFWASDTGCLPEALNRNRGGHRRLRIVSLGNDPDARDDARPGAPVIFHCRCKADVPAPGGDLLHRRVRCGIAARDFRLAP